MGALRSLIDRWRTRHRHQWVTCGFGLVCRECLTCGACRCEDGSSCSSPWCHRPAS